MPSIGRHRPLTMLLTFCSSPLALAKAHFGLRRRRMYLAAFALFALCFSASAQNQSPEEFATALIEAKSNEERVALLDSKKEMITADLPKTLLARGDSLLDQRKWTPARNAYEAMREVSSRLDDKADVALALNKIGVAYFGQNRYQQALGYYQQSLALRKELDDKNGVVNSLTSLAQANLRLGNYTVALEHLTEAYPMLEALKDRAQVANTLNSLGTTHRLTGNYTEALSYYQQAFRIYQAEGHQEGIAGTQLNIGFTYRATGNPDLALHYYQKVLALSEAQGNKQLIASSQNNVGSLYYFQGNYIRAMEWFEKSLRLKEELADERGAANTLANIGSIYHQQGNYAQALSYYRKCLEISQRLEDKGNVGHLLSSIGRIARDQGDYQKAAEEYRKALQIGEEIKNDVLIAEVLKTLGLIYHHQGRRAEALAALEKSLSLTERMGAKYEIADALGNIAAFQLSENKPVEGLKFAEQSYALAKEIGHVEAQQHSLSLRGKAYTLLGQTEKARGVFDEAINLIETLRAQAAGGEQEQQGIFEKGISPYYSMVRLLVSQNKTAEALTYAERGKARVLLDVLRSGRVDISKAMTGEEKEQERGLKIELISLNTQLARARQSDKPDQARIGGLQSRLQKARLGYEAFRDRLYATHPILKAQRGEAPSFKAEESAALLLDAKTALLEYVVMDEATYLFVLTAGGANTTTRSAPQKPVLTLYDLKIKHEDLIARSQLLNKRIANNDIEIAAPSADLYNLLIGPAKAQLHGKTRLIIVPDDILWETPFQALRPTGGRYLIQTAAISYAPSLTVLREMIKSKRTRSGANTLLAMGNPRLADQTISRSKSVLMNASLAPLPEAERMVKQLGQMYGAAASRVYVGESAREDVLKAEAGKHRTLQLATHGVLNNASPMYSHVVLSDSEGPAEEDGLLEAWEIMNLDLKADLAVLSACETARGRIGAGEGVIGLSWAMFVAGVPTTVVSQWKVESSSTTELMLEFHRGLRSGESKSEAMRRAAMKIMTDRRYDHPFYWAGFIVVGDGN